MNVALVGYGEVGRILAADLRRADHGVTAYDIALRSGTAEPMRKPARSHGVRTEADRTRAFGALARKD